MCIRFLKKYENVDMNTIIIELLKFYKSWDLVFFKYFVFEIFGLFISRWFLSK